MILAGIGIFNFRYGTTKEQFAKIAYKNHKHSTNNPYAQFQDEYSLDQILNSKLIFEPLTVSGTSMVLTSNHALYIISEVTV